MPAIKTWSAISIPEVQGLIYTLKATDKFWIINYSMLLAPRSKSQTTQIPAHQKIRACERLVFQYQF